MNIFRNKYLSLFDNVEVESDFIGKNQSNNETNFCVIVDSRSDPILIRVIKNFYYIMKKHGWKFVVWHGLENENMLKSELSNFDVHYISLMCDTFTIHDYNKLLCSAFFWEKMQMLNCEYALIFQSDVILLKPIDDAFFKYDYVGAPWKEPLCITINNKSVIMSIGNGGLSLRRVSKMLNIVNTYSWNGSMPEDVYFSYWLRLTNSIIPSKDEAEQFCMESIFNPCACGIHGKLDWTTDEFNKMMEKYCK